MNILNLLAPGIIGVISVAFLVMTRKLGRTASLFPRILSITIVVLVVYYIAEQLYLNYKLATIPSRDKKDQAKKEAEGDDLKTGRWDIIMASFIIYIGLIYLIGFGMASFFYGIALPYCGGYRKMKVTIPVALGMAILLVVLGSLFHIPLPTGLLLTPVIDALGGY